MHCIASHCIDEMCFIVLFSILFTLLDFSTLIKFVLLFAISFLFACLHTYCCEWCTLEHSRLKFLLLSTDFLSLLLALICNTFFLVIFFWKRNVLLPILTNCELNIALSTDRWLSFLTKALVMLKSCLMIDCQSF